MVLTYNEFRVTYDGGDIVSKNPTKRRTVRISEQTASVNNSYSNSTGLLYEVVSDNFSKSIQGKTPEEVSIGIDAKNKRIALEAKAKELGITFRANIGDDKLSEKIEEIESK